MKPSELAGAVWDTLFRLLPRRAPTGLRPVGQPGRGSPVLLTGNYTLTVRRLLAALEGQDAWLLVANSRGINVWCAAGGGHLTHHDVISVLRTSGVAERVDHRELILPQLAATGVERTKVEEATGWKPRWGPARLEDLPGFLARGRRVRRPERLMRFPLWERLEMSLIWTPGLAAVGAPLIAWWAGWRVALASAVPAIAAVTAVFALLPRLDLRRGREPLVLGGFAVAAAAAAVGLLAAAGTTGLRELAIAAGAQLATLGILAIDLKGTTPCYPSTVNTLAAAPRVEVVEERCDGAAACVLVCPRGVLTMDGARRKVEVTAPDACILCGACIVQCPTDALQFRYDDGRVLEPQTVRRTRLNLMGKRAIRVPEG